MPVIMRRVVIITLVILVSIIGVASIFDSWKGSINNASLTPAVIDAGTDRSSQLSLGHIFFLAGVTNTSQNSVKGVLTSPDGGTSVVESNATYPRRPGRYTLQIPYSPNGEEQVTVLVKFIVPGYTVSINDSFYVAISVDGLVVSQNQDFADMMNSLFTRLVPGDIVLIRGGEYSLTKSIRNTNRNGITLLGESGTVFKATSGNTDGMLWIYSGGGGLNPSNCVVEGITFDANYNTVISPTVGIGGSYNTVQNCTFLNTMQYGLLAWRAHNFKFIYNYVEQAQYGISTGADENEWCSDGLISNNFITDSSDCAIKLRWVTDTLVYNNTIEVVKTNCKGIRYYHADGPTVNTTVTHNIIRGDPSAGLTSGVWVDYDSRALSSGSYIADNVVNGCYYGVHNDWGRVSIVDNVVINAHVPIYNSNDDAIISDNIIS